MFFISSVINKEKTDKDVFHYPKLKIIPKVINDKLELYCELYLYGLLEIPNNSLLLDLKTNFGNFENIPINMNYSKIVNYDLYFENTVYFDLKDNKELTTKLHENKILEFYPKLKIDKNAFNAANLTLDVENVDKFIQKISFINKDNLIKEQYYFSNYYSLHDLSIKNVKENQINKPDIQVPIFNRTLNYNQWSNISNFINFYFISNETAKIEWVEIKIDYFLPKISLSKKSFKHKIEMNKNDDFKLIKKDSLYTNFNYEKNEILLSDKLNGYQGIFLPFISNGTIKLTLKINSTIYGQDFNFKINQNLFGNENSKFNLKIESSNNE